jgi:chemotaxis signal transduction protein
MQELSSLHLIFGLGGRRFAIPVGQVREVVPYPDPVPVPRAPDFVAGVVNHHGQIVTVLDLGRFLGVRLGERRPPTHLLILAREADALGVACEGVVRIEALPQPGEAEAESTGEGEVCVVDLDQALSGLESYFG